MAATAYAALVSLTNTMDQIQIHPLLSACFDSFQFGSLRKKVDFLVDFVENHHSDAVTGEEVDFPVDADSTVGEDLLSQIAVVAHMAEDMIEVEAADLVLGGSTDKTSSFLQDLQKIIQDMDLLIKEVRETELFVNSMPPPSSLSSSSSSSSSAPLATTKTRMVGFDNYVVQLLDELTSMLPRRQILPVVGMGGIGKTTLARNVCQNSLIIYHFDVRVWVTVSQSFSERNILLQALSCLGGSKSKTDTSDDEVGEELYKKLSGRRYLIILDDMWGLEAWEKFKFFFPENHNRSRIVVTTREHQLVDYFAASALALDFLDDEKSWDLFCSKTFGQQGCPPELEEVGKKIVTRCKGLPLAITVTAGLLGNSPRTREHWEEISRDRSLILEYSGEGNKVLSILYLSYKHLPVCLKPCFLYLGLFPEDHQIDVSLLIKFWAAEGFIKPNRYESLEDVSERNIKELVDRNLLLLGDLRLNKKFKTCHVHDLVRELCIRLAEKEKFYHVQRNIDGTRHYVVDARSANLFYPQQSSTTTSERPSVIEPLIFDGEREAPLKSRLLRVYVDHTGHANFQQVSLRFLFCKSDISPKTIPWSVSLCWGLQTLIVRESFSVLVSPEIWKMPQLRHIDISSLHLSDPPSDNDSSVLENLQTLKRVKNLSFSEEVCKRIPNIKALEIEYDFSEKGGSFHLQKVGCLKKLESLQLYSSTNRSRYAGGLLQSLKLPLSLKELNLWNLSHLGSDMATISSLPRLEILELHGKIVVGTEWRCVGEKFPCLKHLRIHLSNDLIYWIADSSSFPVLETLSLEILSKLEEIPSGIGEITTIEKIYVFDCSETATISAVKILEEQESLGNESLQLHLEFSYKVDAELWRERNRDLGFTSKNLHISSNV